LSVKRKRKAKAVEDVLATKQAKTTSIKTEDEDMRDATAVDKEQTGGRCLGARHK